MSLPDYQCVRIGDIWHATQEQASPPPITRMGAYTVCTKWAEFRAGFERSRPDCPGCLDACVRDEQRRFPDPPPPK